MNNSENADNEIDPCEENMAEDFFKEKIENVSKKLCCDIFAYFGPIQEPYDRHFIEKISAKPKEKHTILILATYGGSADAAFRIARAFQKRAEDTGGHFFVFIPDYCKSAGTLICIGANQLIMGKNGELGPLDVQLSNKDDLAGFSSGLTPIQTLASLRDESFRMFEQQFLDIYYRAGQRISTKMAMEISSKMTTGLFGNLYSQIDPLLLGETYRSMSVGLQYGEILLSWSGNLGLDSLKKIVFEYPSHSFVIDYTEAEKLFSKVLPPTDDLEIIAKLLEPTMRNGLRSEDPIFFPLTYDTPTSDDQKNEHVHPKNVLRQKISENSNAKDTTEEFSGNGDNEKCGDGIATVSICPSDATGKINKKSYKTT